MHREHRGCNLLHLTFATAHPSQEVLLTRDVGGKSNPEESERDEKERELILQDTEWVDVLIASQSLLRGMEFGEESVINYRWVKPTTYGVHKP